MAALHYVCKGCEQNWLGDCWCPECGKICKPDPKYHGYDKIGRPKNEEVKWTKKSMKEAIKKARAKKFYNPYK